MDFDPKNPEHINTIIEFVQTRKRPQKQSHTSSGIGASFKRTENDLQTKKNHDTYCEEAYAIPGLCMKIALFLLACCHNSDTLMSFASMSMFYANCGRVVVCVLMFMSYCAVCRNFSASYMVLQINYVILGWVASFCTVNLLVLFDAFIWQYWKETWFTKDTFTGTYDSSYQNTKLHLNAVSKARDELLFGIVFLFLVFHALLQSSIKNHEDRPNGAVLTWLLTLRCSFQPKEKMNRSKEDESYCTMVQKRPPAVPAVLTSYFVNVCLVVGLVIYRSRMCFKVEWDVCAAQVLELDWELYCSVFLYLFWLCMQKNFVRPMMESTRVERQECVEIREVAELQPQNFSPGEKSTALAWAVICILSMQFIALCFDLHRAYFASNGKNNVHDHWVAVIEILMTVVWPSRHTAMVIVAIGVHFVCTDVISAASRNLAPDASGKFGQNGILVGKRADSEEVKYFIQTDEPALETET